ncbi:hypothetical protein SLE2022_092180 [Rubroshorea leprosula]
MERGRKSAAEEPASYMEIPTENQDRAPMHYLLKVESFSQLSELLSETIEKRCESTAFEAGGYKWKLVLYPVGNKARNGDGHVSLYRMIVELELYLVDGLYMLISNFLCMDHVQDRFCTFEDSNAKVRCFHALKTELGFPRLLSLGDFKDPSNGYLVGDACVFGVQVLVQDYIENQECLPTSVPEDKPFSWKIQHFSEQNEEMIESESFIAGGLEWVVQLYPKGNPERNSAGNLSMYLMLKDSTAESMLTCARFSLLIKNQRNYNDVSFTDTGTGSNFARGWGRAKVIPLSRLQNPTLGFLVDDTLVVEAKVETIFKLRSVS